MPFLDDLIDFSINYGLAVDSVSSFNATPASEKVLPSPYRVPPSPSRFSPSPRLSRLGSVHLNLSQVVRATHNFSPSLQIGEGGFGIVYKARLDNGQMVAIKRAKKVSRNTLHDDCDYFTFSHCWLM